MSLVHDGLDVFAWDTEDPDMRLSWATGSDQGVARDAHVSSMAPWTVAMALHWMISCESHCM